MQRSGIDTTSTTPDPGYQWESDRLIVDTTNESQEVSPFPAGDHKAHINRRAQRHSKHNPNPNKAIGDDGKVIKCSRVSPNLFLNPSVF